MPAAEAARVPVAANPSVRVAIYTAGYDFRMPPTMRKPGIRENIGIWRAAVNLVPSETLLVVDVAAVFRDRPTGARHHLGFSADVQAGIVRSILFDNFFAKLWGSVIGAVETWGPAEKVTVIIFCKSGPRMINPNPPALIPTLYPP